MGSALAVMHVLRSRGVEARVIVPNAIPLNLMWLPGAEVAEVYDAAKHSGYLDTVKAAVILDLSSAARFQPIAGHIMRPSCQRIVVDHHVEPEPVAQVMHVDTASAATCLILANVLRPLVPDGLSTNVAQCLYTGIYTDTGGFRFPRTDAELFRVVASLVADGADPVLTHECLYNRAPFSRLVLLGKALASMQIFHHGATAIMALSSADLEAHGATTEDLDGFVHHTLSIDGVDAGVLIAEVDNQVKISFRSKGTMFIREVAAEFGGGGHNYAAGARIASRPLQSVVNDVVERLGSYRERARVMRSIP
jgi:phosphoesterase RecJ-like protein